MSFLNNTGLAYFYSKLKEKFIQTVNGSTPDIHGNVQINQVPLAENLVSPDAQASIDTFIYRTSGGSASLASGEANLVLINGNMIVDGRVEEAASVNTGNTVVITVNNITTLATEVGGVTGDYVLSYTKPSSNVATNNWAPSAGTWAYGGSTLSGGLSDWGLSATGLTMPLMSVGVSGGGVSAATVQPNTFIQQAGLTTSGMYTISYVVEYEPQEGEEEPVISDEYWSFRENQITLSTYGIVATGTPQAGDTININYVHGINNFNATVSYTAPLRGTIKLATPTSFQATGFNQFDKNTMVISNATISGGTIVSHSGTFVCYCRAVGGDHGYIAESLGGYIDLTGGMGWCENLPAIGSSVITTSKDITDSVTTYSADFTYSDDGYMVVVVTDASDLMMWCEWSGDVNGQEEYTAYVAPSVVPIPTIGTINGTNYSLPTASYGMPRLGTVYDTINFESSQYIKRIERLAYSAENLAFVQAMSPVPVYDWDYTNIFYVLESPIIYTFDNTTFGIYTVDDHGTEEFTGTEISVVAEMLYGQNLRDKLRTDVLTISSQNPSLSTAQMEQVLNNLGWVVIHTWS